MNRIPVVLDTTFLVDLGRRRAGAVELLERLRQEGESLLVPSVAVAEYLAGARDPEHDLARLEEAAAILDFTAADARAAARLAREAFARGEFPGWTDVFVAGFAASRGGLPIVTANPRQFPRARTISY